MQRRDVNPTTWLDPFGIQQGVEVTRADRVLYLTAQTSTSADGQPVHDGDMLAQFQLAWSNLKDVLDDSRMSPENVVRLNVFTTDLPLFMEHAQTIGEMVAVDGATGASTILGVEALLWPELMIALEATAVA